MTRWITGVAFAAAAMVAAPASAELYVIDFTLDNSTATGTAALTTAGDASAGFSLVTAVTGTYNGLPLTLLPPDSYPAPGTTISNDNLFTAIFPYFDSRGISFEVGGLLPIYLNLYYGEPFNQFCTTRPPDTTCGAGGHATITLRETASGVPEPGTWTMLIAGFGAIGIAARRMRRRKARPGAA